VSTFLAGIPQTSAWTMRADDKRFDCYQFLATSPFEFGDPVLHEDDLRKLFWEKY
jgi:hypothetical protein